MRRCDESRWRRDVEYQVERIEVSKARPFLAALPALGIWPQDLLGEAHFTSASTPTDSPSINRKSRRKATAVCRDTHRLSTPSVKYQLADIRHRRHRHTSSRSIDTSSALQRPFGDGTSTSNLVSALSTVPSTLPQSTKARRTTQHSAW